MPRARPLRRRRLTAAAAAVALAACGGPGDAEPVAPSAARTPATTPPPPTSASTTTTAPEPAVVGAPGRGDGYFPGAGNGGYDVERYDLDLRYDPASGRLDGRATIAAVATAPLSAFHLDLVGLQVSAVDVDGDPAAFALDGRELLVTPAAPLPSGERFEAVVAYGGQPTPVATGVDVLPAVGWTAVAGGAYVLGEPTGAATWFPANDHPADKARFGIRVTVPAGFEVAANGLGAPAVDNGDGTTTWAFELRDPMATYLATVAVGRFTFDQAAGPAGVVVRNAFAEDLAPAAAAAFADQAAMIDFFDDRFGPYPFEAYGALVVDAELDVALETQTLSLFSGEVLALEPAHLAELIAHELAHQWFGDSVTPASWRDIWLNESFATYAQWLWAEHDGGPTVAVSVAEWHGVLAASGLGAVPPGDPGVADLFAPSVYFRGAIGLHALRGTVGDGAFFEILRRWAADNEHATASTEGFVALAEEVAGVPLDDLFLAWLYAPTLPPMP